MHLISGYFEDDGQKKLIICGDLFDRGEDADFSPYYGNGIIALDACTARSKKFNVIVVED